ncbi:MAG: helix-turn-helix domain-containing protein [Gemmataceae bacterium]
MVTAIVLGGTALPLTEVVRLRGLLAEQGQLSPDAKKIFLALQECSPQLREAALGLVEDLASGELDEYQTTATTTLLAEILFPNADDTGLPGLAGEVIEQIALGENPEASGVLSAMDTEEATFAERLQHWMLVRGLTQAQLAAKVGIGQPAVSMFLKRDSRPQMKTVHKFAEALNVPITDLWPS